MKRIDFCLVTITKSEDSTNEKFINYFVLRRNLFDPNYNKQECSDETRLDTADSDSVLVPKIRIQGPFGGGNQDWYKFEVAVMIGAGIGVTPYASILNDLVFGTSTNRYSGVACKKVYFLWICQSHRQFEWFIDVLREVEKKDVTNVLEIHIFITQFFHKFDLRTTMLVSSTVLIIHHSYLKTFY